MFDPAFDPIERLAELNVRIVRHPLRHNDALWIPNRRMVIMDKDIHPAMVKPVLTHEWAHAISNDPGGHHPKHENSANLRSAMILTDPNQWNDLTSVHSDYDHICLELGITRRQFMAYYHHQLRRAA